MDNQTLKLARDYVRYTDSMTAMVDCDKCDGTGIIMIFQHEGNEPHSGFSHPEICGCVWDSEPEICHCGQAASDHRFETHPFII